MLRLLFDSITSDPSSQEHNGIFISVVCQLSTSAVLTLVTLVCLVCRCATFGFVLTSCPDGCLSRNAVQLHAQALVVNLSQAGLLAFWCANSRVAHGSMTPVLCSAAEAAICAKHCNKNEQRHEARGGKEDRINAQEESKQLLFRITHTRSQENGVGPKQNPCHQQLNNSSCISASQGILSRGYMIGRMVFEQCEPLFLVCEEWDAWMGSRRAGGEKTGKWVDIRDGGGERWVEGLWRGWVWMSVAR
jgi:hypothetical protein